MHTTIVFHNPSFDTNRPVHMALGVARNIVGLACLLFLSACFTAKQDVASADCYLTSKSWTLEFSKQLPKGMQIASNSCDSVGCLLSFVVSGGVIATGSFVIAGSIVVVGNTMHWLEKSGKCSQSSIQHSLDSVRSIYDSAEVTFIETKQQLLERISQ